MKSAYSLAFVLALAAPGMAHNLSGRWDATIQFDDYKISFPIEFSGEGSQVSASFFNGDERITSTAGNLDGNTVSVRFEHYATQLDATITDGVLKGTYGSKRNGFHEIEARPHQDASVSLAKVPDITGLWDIPNESPKGEHAWRLIVRQNGPETSAAILRVDGDTGAIAGSYSDGKFVLNHFDGARAYVLEITPRQDGTLALSLRGGHSAAKDYIAMRSLEARSKGIPEPTDPEKHTRVKDENQPFQFSFPDVDGKIVSSTDPQFRNKVVIVNITGSWCPNCHDEAPFLVELGCARQSRRDRSPGSPGARSGRGDTCRGRDDLRANQSRVGCPKPASDGWQTRPAPGRPSALAQRRCTWPSRGRCGPALRAA